MKWQDPVLVDLGRYEKEQEAWEYYCAYADDHDIEPTAEGFNQWVCDAEADAAEQRYQERRDESAYRL